MIGYTLDLDDPFEATMWSLCLTSFFLMLRKSNVCKMYGTKNRFLKCEHISVGSNKILVQIFWTKTLQLGERGCSLCPVATMKNMLQLVPTKPNMALFSRQNGSPMTYPIYMKFIKDKIDQIGLNSKNYSTHSFRRGAVSWAIKNGIPESLIEVMGDWKSNCYKMYINCPLDVRTHFVEQFVHNM